jgi:hypothetical protein
MKIQKNLMFGGRLEMISKYQSYECPPINEETLTEFKDSAM